MAKKTYGRFFGLDALEGRRFLSIQGFSAPTNSAALRSETVGKDGSLYFVEADQQQIGRILPNKRIIEYTIPDSFGGIGTLVTARDGSIWFNTTNAHTPLLGHLTTNGKVREVDIDTGDASNIGAASDGSIWFSTVQEGFGQVSARGAVKYFAAGQSGAQDVTKIIAGARGGIYYASVTTPAGAAPGANTFSIHQAGIVKGQYQDTTLFQGDTPFGFGQAGLYESANDLALGPDGNLWFYDGNAIQAEDPNAGQIVGSIDRSEFAGISGVSSLTSGPDGKLWFVDHKSGGKVWTFSVDGEIGSTELPGGGSTTPYSIVSGKGKTLWITDETGGTIYNMDLGRPAPAGRSVLSDVVSETGIDNFGYISPGPFQVALGFANTSTYDSFLFQRADSRSGPYETIGTVPAASGFIGFIDQNVQPLTTYYYRVRGVRGGSIAAYLGPLQASIPQTHYFAP